MIVGYARVSTDGQTLDAQQAALREAGCAAKVYSEKISGAVADRPALAKAIGALADGDTLVVCKLDRLARTTRGLAQHPRRNREGWRNLQITCRWLG